jgi:hypothetical protein
MENRREAMLGGHLEEPSESRVRKRKDLCCLEPKSEKQRDFASEIIRVQCSKGRDVSHVLILHNAMNSVYKRCSSEE